MVTSSISCYCHLGNIQSVFWGCSHNFLPNNNSKLTVKHTYLYASSIGREKNMSHLKMIAAMDDNTSSSSISTTTTDSGRPLANFHSSVWGDYFLSYTPQLTEISSQEKVEFEELKEKVRQMLVETPDNSTQKLELIDTNQRLGVAYHFGNEIQTSITNIFDLFQQSENEDDDLYVAALRFRLLRQQRHFISSDAFKKFTNKDGRFKETLTKNVQGLLSLYEAAHLRVHGEEILEQALSFTLTNLESMGPKLSNTSLKAQVSAALSQPIYTNLPRLGAKKYMCMYEKNESHNDLLLKFAKLDFNIVQKVYQRELYELTRYWWKDLDYANNFPYARDRLVECYYGAVGVLFEPQYSRTRKILGKLINVITMVDDTFDAYATFDEIVAFTNAIERCDISVMDSISPNLRPAYQVLIDFFNEMEKELAKEGKADRVYYAKFEMKKCIRAYFKEAQWLNVGYIPKCDEYLENGSASIGIMLMAVTSLVGLEELITKETLEWVINDPLILRVSGVISRLKDDIIGHNFEQQRGHVASFIECYMKEHGVSKQEAYAAVDKEMANAWKDINTEFFRPSQVPTFVLERIINPTRLVIGFQENDFINTQGEYKDKITSLLVDSMKI